MSRDVSPSAPGKYKRNVLKYFLRLNVNWQVYTIRTAKDTERARKLISPEKTFDFTQIDR